MTEQKQSCGECHWWGSVSPNLVNYRMCEGPVPKCHQIEPHWTAPSYGADCPTFRQRGERLPQRFRYRHTETGTLNTGCCLPYSESGVNYWQVITEDGSKFFIDDDTSRKIRKILSDKFDVVWIDNDFGWSGK